MQHENAKNTKLRDQQLPEFTNADNSMTGNYPAVTSCTFTEFGHSSKKISISVLRNYIYSRYVLPRLEALMLMILSMSTH